jgi:membrane protein required for colicin V production
MHTFDIILLSALVGATLFGFAKGVMWQIAWLAALLASYFAAMKFGPSVAPLVGDRRYTAMLIVYVATNLLIWVVYHQLRDVIGRLKLREFDRQIGALLGFALGVLLCVTITFFALMLSGEEQQDAILASRGGDMAARAIVRMKQATPDEVHEFLCDKLPDEVHDIVHPHHADEHDEHAEDDDHGHVANQPPATSVR